MNTEKDLIRLMEEIQKRGLKSDQEIQDFFKEIQGDFNNLPKSKRTKKSHAEDLVYEAYELPPSKGKKLIKKALELDPNNVEAYNYLAGLEKDLNKAIQLYEKAVKVGEKTLGKKFFKEEKGHFWGMVQTRPYMRAKISLAGCLYANKEDDKAIAIYEEMLELNPNDNQGVRYLLSTILLKQKDLTKFQLFIEQSDEENNAVWNYNNALFLFKKYGNTVKSEKALLIAQQSNEYVIDYLLGNKEMPNELPQYIGFGDENEAIVYANSHWLIWKETKDAFQWIYDFREKRLKMN